MAQEEGMKRVRLIAVLALAGCGSLAPGAEKVLLTRNAVDVAGCKVVAPVHIRPEPFTSGAKDMRNAAFGYGGDTVFVTSGVLDAVRDGMAYNCKGIDLRQPVPVQPKP
jgi:hypothetical protein